MWATGEILSSAAWGIGEPVTNDCGAFDGVNKKWQSYPCDTPLNVLCFVDTLVVVHERKTWEEALEHCKSLEIQHNLVTVESELDYIRVGKRIYMATEEVWTGLRFLGGQWWWVNGEPLNNQMLPSCPEPLSHCGAFSKTNNDILLMDCTKKLHFICQRII
ncbi:lymphocyte antigen 75-like [Eucyclogobius newberryi]|uniref:lymphocyte antigen 75-like n=1 Tax=Eucyclogobius newberryi TaxID=166745 RepID=UPI003B5CDE46